MGVRGPVLERQRATTKSVHSYFMARQQSDSGIFELRLHWFFWSTGVVWCGVVWCRWLVGGVDVAAQGSTVAVEDVFEGSAVAVEDVAEGSTVAVEDVAKGSMFAADAVEHEGIVFEAPGPLELDELMAVVARERALGLWTPTGTPASFSWSEDETDGASDGDDGRP